MLKHRVLSNQLGSQTTVSSRPSRCQDPRASPQLSEPYLKTQRERGLWGMKPPRGQAAESTRNVEKRRKHLQIWNPRNHVGGWRKVMVFDYKSLSLRPEKEEIAQRNVFTNIS